MELGRLALELYDAGFKLARGDSTIAAALACAAAQGAIGIVELNLRPYGNDSWARQTRKMTAQLYLETQALANQLQLRLREAIAPAVCPEAA